MTFWWLVQEYAVLSAVYMLFRTVKVYWVKKNVRAKERMDTGMKNLSSAAASSSFEKLFIFKVSIVVWKCSATYNAYCTLELDILTAILI